MFRSLAPSLLILAAACPIWCATASAATAATPPAATTTPIRHLVVVFQENVSFDHYFATYPVAANGAGETPFHAAPGTPVVNGLTRALREHNPNAAQPFRLGPDRAVTCDMDHGYVAEQRAFDGGLMDKFVEFTSNGTPGCDRKTVMGYYDGNTVTALWNYAQHYAMSDNSFGTGFGPSTPGAINLVSGNTHGATPATLGSGDDAEVAQGTVIGDPEPLYDDCSSTSSTGIAMHGRNVGDLLNDNNVTWGWFQGGFRLSAVRDGKAVCDADTVNRESGERVQDYVPHHEPFQYYEQTANPHHTPPDSVAMIGRTDPAKHQYDLIDFYAALEHGTMPAVSFVKAKAAENGHADNSDPLDEQAFLVTLVNALAQSRYWQDSAIIIAYDDSDGWYDHVMPRIVNGSALADLDALSGAGKCGHAPAAGGYQGRCGYGPRLPLLLISRYARVNFVDHSRTDQTSILRFIEDNWSLGRIGDHSMDARAGSLEGMFDFEHGDAAPLLLDPATGQVRSP